MPPLFPHRRRHDGAMAVAVVGGVVALAAIWTARFIPVGSDEPVCPTPVQVQTRRGAYLGCATDEALSSCGPLSRGDRVQLDAGLCRRVAGGMDPSVRLLVGLPIDINRAGSSDLERLPGIGRVKARAIVTFREEHGRFDDVSGLARVRGIGPVTLRRLEGLVEVR